MDEDNNFVVEFAVLGGNRWYKIYKREGKAGLWCSMREFDGHHYAGPFGTKDEAWKWIEEKVRGSKWQSICRHPDSILNSVAQGGME